VSDDPEYCYRRGFQHGAWKVLEAIMTGTAGQERLRAWIEIDLAKWRHDPNTGPNHPKI
jgi:hypothetical protein